MTRQPLTVRAFRNLTRHCLSIQAKCQDGHWRTVAHSNDATISGASFHVQPGGRARTLRTGRKCVHAWVQGTATSLPAAAIRTPAVHLLTLASKAALLDASRAHFCEAIPDGEAVTYNPARNTTFVVRATGAAVHTSPRVTLTSYGVTAEIPVDVAA